MAEEEFETQPDSKGNSAQITGWVLVGVGILGGFVIYGLTSQAAWRGDFGEGGILVSIMAGVIGFAFAAFFSIIGIVVLATTSKKEHGSTVADGEVSDLKAIAKKPGRYQG
jgi:hypothetical protein